ncbi:MAG: hypothetical protein HY775_03595 [Acidobacteria bacterium]|nr:hypothetical protein [Acidobacteriota bacterium]
MEQPPQTPKPPDWGEMKGKLTAARGPDRLILIAGVLFFVDTFLAWFGLSTQFGSVNGNAWDVGGTATVASLLAILTTAFAAARVLGAKFKVGNVNDGLIYLVLGGGTFVFTLLRFVLAPGALGIHLGRKYGIFIALVLAAVMAFGSYQKYQAASK